MPTYDIHIIFRYFGWMGFITLSGDSLGTKKAFCLVLHQNVMNQSGSLIRASKIQLAPATGSFESGNTFLAVKLFKSSLFLGNCCTGRRCAQAGGFAVRGQIQETVMGEFLVLSG